MSWSKMIALGLLGSFAAMAAATWWYGITGGPLVTRVGSFGTLLVFAAPLGAMLIVVLWRSREPVVSARAAGWERDASATDIVAELQRQAARGSGERRPADDQAGASFTKSSPF